MNVSQPGTVNLSSEVWPCHHGQRTVLLLSNIYCHTTFKTRYIEFLIISEWFISQNVAVLTNYNNILKRSRSVKMVTLDTAPPWPLGASLTVLDIVIIPILNNPG